DDGQPVVDVRLAGIVIDFGRDEAAIFLVLVVSRDEGLLDGLHHHLARNAFFGGELGDGSHEFTFHVWHALRSITALFKIKITGRWHSAVQQKKWGLPTSKRSVRRR